MFFLKREEQTQIRILIGIVLTIGILYIFLTPNHVPLKKAVITTKDDFEVDFVEKDESISNMEDISQVGKATPNKIFINKSPFEDLLCAPGIGRKIAAQIIEERNLCPFYDWRNFQDRIKGISDLQLEVLKDSGVRLNPPEN